MANKRMFAKQIVDSDAFLDMPTSSQLLYFQFVMHADDEGFVGNPKKIMRMVGVGDDDFKILIAKRFILSFESGVIVIKHWLIHNAIRMDRFNTTAYQDEKKLLQIKDNKAYTELATKCQPSGNQMAGQVKLSEVKLIKDKLSKSNITSEETSQIVELIDTFKEVNPSYSKFFANKSQRSACQRMLKVHGLEKLQKIIKFLPQSNVTQYMPVITTPVQLEDKFAQLATAWQKIKNKTPIIL